MQNTAKPSSGLLKIHLSATPPTADADYAPLTTAEIGVCQTCLKVDLDSQRKGFLSKASMHTACKGLTRELL